MQTADPGVGGFFIRSIVMTELDLAHTNWPVLLAGFSLAAAFLSSLAGLALCLKPARSQENE